MSKDPHDYQYHTLQHKIGKLLNKQLGSLIKYYKTGQQKDGYKGYSTNYQDLDIDIYKTEFWKLIKDVLILLDCDVQNLEEEIFRISIEDENTGNDATLSGIVYTSKANERHGINNNYKIQKNESLDKYRSMHHSLVVLARSSG